METLDKFIQRIVEISKEYHSGDFNDIGLLNFAAVIGEHAMAKSDELDAEWKQVKEKLAHLSDLER